MFLALRDLRFARGRFALMASVIALLALLVGALSSLAAGLAGQSVSAVRSLPADSLAFAAPDDGESASFSTSTVGAGQLAAYQSRPGVRAEPLGVTPTRLSTAGVDVPVTVFAAPTDGWLAPAALSPGTTVIGAELAAEEGLAAGDEVAIGGTRATVAIGDGEWFNHTPVVWLPIDQMRELDGTGAGVATVVALQSADQVDAVAGTTTISRDDAVGAVGSFQAENGSLTMIRVLLLAVGALVVGAFFSVWTIQRTPDLAVLKATGASTGYLVRDALTQAFVVLVVGGGAGALLASGLSALVSDVVPVVVDAGTTLLPLLALLVLGMAGAAAAVRRIATIDPLTALGAAR